LVVYIAQLVLGYMVCFVVIEERGLLRDQVLSKKQFLVGKKKFTFQTSTLTRSEALSYGGEPLKAH